MFNKLIWIIALFLLALPISYSANFSIWTSSTITGVTTYSPLGGGGTNPICTAMNLSSTAGIQNANTIMANITAGSGGTMTDLWNVEMGICEFEVPLADCVAGTMKNFTFSHKEPNQFKNNFTADTSYTSDKLSYSYDSTKNYLFRYCLPADDMPDGSTSLSYWPVAGIWMSLLGTTGKTINQEDWSTAFNSAHVNFLYNLVGEEGDIIPPEINFYNMTSDGNLGCINWNTNKQNPCKTSDKTPTVRTNLSESSFCAISTLNLNYTDMIANDALTNCTGAPGNILTCMLPSSKEFASPGLFNISIGCKDEAGNENLTSTSGRLLLNITDLTPPNITLNEPDNNAVLFFKDRPFTFNFTANDNFGLLNLSCNLYFNNTLNQTNSTVKNGTKTSWAPINLSRDTWQWNVTCFDNSSNADSSARLVIINNSRPTAPTLQTPANDSGFGNEPSNLPEFTWLNSDDEDNDVDVTDTITYIVEVNNESDFSGTVAYYNDSVPEDSDGTTGVNVTLPSTDEDAYFWRVRANDGFENSSFSQTFQFAYANWTITFNLTSSDTGKAIDTSGSPTIDQSFDILCVNGYTATDVENPHGSPNTDNAFSHGIHNCTFADIIDRNGEEYRTKTTTFTAGSDKTVEVVVSRIGGLTEEEHQWLEALYTCFNTGECIDLLRNINETTTNTWKRVTGTDTSVVTFENITSNTLSSASNISIDYTINIPQKEGYAVGELLPLRMFFWITDVNKTTCFNQDKASDTNKAEAPYCLPLVAETLGPNGGQVNFTVNLRPSVPDGDYNITRSIEIDPIVNNAVTWINYGQENIGQIKVLEAGNADLFLLKTGESIPVRTATQAATGINGAAVATQLTTSMVGIVLTFSVIILGLLGYIIYINKKK